MPRHRRRHTNTTGRRQIQNGSTARQVERIAQRLKVPKQPATQDRR